MNEEKFEWIISKNSIERIFAIDEKLQKIAFNNYINAGGTFQKFSPIMYAISETSIKSIEDTIFDLSFIPKNNNLLQLKVLFESDNLRHIAPQILDKICIGYSSDESRDVLINAFDLIHTTEYFWKKISPIAIKQIIPFLNTDAPEGKGFSTQRLQSTVFFGTPYGRFAIFEQAMNIAHEIGHQILNLYAKADSIVIDVNKKIYSPVLEFDRPIFLAFHASFAIVYINRFLSSLIDSEKQLKSSGWDFPDTNFLFNLINENKNKLEKSMSQCKSNDFTDFGNLLANEINQYNRS